MGGSSVEEQKSKGCKNPYNVKRKYLDEESMTGDEWYNWQIKVINELLRITKKYVIYNVQGVVSIRKYVYKLMGYFSEYIYDDVIWYKENPIPTSTENSMTNSYEHILILNKNKKPVKVNSKHYFKNVIQLPCNSNKDFSDIHHAVMNLNLSNKIIEEFTIKEDLVYDAFFGCGTTGLSCKLLGRKYTGTEINKTYYDVSIDRIANNGKYQKEITDEEFNEMPLFKKK